MGNIASAYTGGNASLAVPVDLTSTAALPVFGAGTTGDANNRVQLGADGSIRFGTGAGAVDTAITRSGANNVLIGSNTKLGAGGVDVVTAGVGLSVAEGANAKQGTFTLAGGTSQTIANTSVTANSRIFLGEQLAGGTPGLIGVASRIAGTSFTVSCVATDTSTYAYEIFEPG